MVINIFSFPEHSLRRTITIKYIKELIGIVNSEYGIHLDVEVRDSHTAHHSFSQFLMEFLKSCKKNKKYIDIYWLAYLNWVVREPSPELQPGIKSLLVELDLKFLEPFLLKAQSNAGDWNSAVGAQFIVLENLKLKKGQGPWGANIGTYPGCVTIETTSYRESIFHEFLHQFGVTEGYDENTKSTLKGCERCWMQWEAVRGKDLCEKHRRELKTFIEVHLREW